MFTIVRKRHLPTKITMKTETSINVLNSLIEINNDRIEGYETASKETDEADVKTLFAECSKTSQHCNAELIYEVQTLGGTPLEGTKMSGKFFRVWMDVKAAVTITDRRTILKSCELGEEFAIQKYKDVLAKNLVDLTSEQQTMINEQYVLIQADHDGVKNLRDMSPK
jgi:uncharacterized protein (TIGR02284 family)